MDDIKPPARRPSDRPKFSGYAWNSAPASRPKSTVPDKETSDVEEFFKPKNSPKPKPKAKLKPIKPAKHKRRSKKLLAILPLLIGVVAAGYWFGVRPRLHPKAATPVAVTPAAKPIENTQPKALTGNFRIVATGDILTHDSVIQNAKTASGGYDFLPMLSELKPFMDNAHTRICHENVPAAGGNLSGYPNFNAPSDLIAGLAGSGCNVLSLASDHIGDKGQAAIETTLQAVETQKSIVLAAGANRSVEEKAKDRYFNVADGVVKFAYFSYTNRQNHPAETTYGVNTYDKNAMIDDIKKVRATADFVMVSMCWGKEDSGDIQADQDVIAQELTDAGADIVFGHCTHVVQPVKRLKSADGAHETIVYYSLGNSLSSQLPIETLVGGLGVVDIDLATKKITTVGLLPTYMHYEWTAAEKSSRNLGARKNLKLYPLDKAAAPLAASQNGTTVEAQTQRLQEILNRFTPTKLLTSADLSK